ncbi:hypothetical protein BDW59DRAFT_173696 [Aspergillus cavernicola]|uniref:Uncharacterized protein n=1 Tax=Aspergillus cavernicola TaxID=176166 RepID=A0ABR4I632_9EURO
MQESRIDICGRPVEPPNHFRFCYGNGPGVDVYGWPSKGGVYSLQDCTPVEIEFLGYDRLNVPRHLKAESEEEEDAHCNHMRRLGATWWARYEDLSKFTVFGDKNLNLNGFFIRVGWPDGGGGAWVLHTTIDEAAERGTGLIDNAYTMEERCMMIERMGGGLLRDP